MIALFAPMGAIFLLQRRGSASATMDLQRENAVDVYTSDVFLSRRLLSTIVDVILHLVTALLTAARTREQLKFHRQSQPLSSVSPCDLLEWVRTIFVLKH